MAIATNIIEQNGVDSKIGLIASVIMGATESTLYTIAVYTSSIKVKKTRYILIASLLADITGIISAIIICNKFYLPYMLEILKCIWFCPLPLNDCYCQTKSRLHHGRRATLRLQPYRQRI